MKHFLLLIKLFGTIYFSSVFIQARAQSPTSTVVDINNDYGTSVPPDISISYVFGTTVDVNGCQFKWEATNSSNLGQSVTTGIPTFPIVWNNTNGNASVKVTTQGCTISGSNGTTATYSAPIRYLGQVGSISSNPANPLACGSQTVTFNAGTATNANSYQWDYSNLAGWNYVSGQGTTNLTMTSSPGTGGFVSITARRSNAPNTSTSSFYNVSRPSQPAPIISGPAAFCPGTTAFYGVPNASGSAFNWSVSPNLQIVDGIVNGVGTSQIGVQGQSAGDATISVQVSGCGATTSSNLAVKLGAAVGGTYTNGGSTFQVQSSNGITLSNSNPTCYINLNSAWPSATYSWQVTNQSSSGASINANGSSAGITCSGGKQLSATCTINTPCGSSQVSFNCYNTSSGFRMAAYPNPASQDITIATVKNETQSAAKYEDEGMAADKPVQEDELIDIDANIRLLDKNNTVVQEGKLVEGKLKLSVAKLADGIYYLQLNFGEKQIRKQILIQH